MKMRTTGNFALGVVLWLLIGLQPVAAGPREDVAAAVAAIDEKDFGRALGLLMPLAKSGNVFAQGFLGALYLEGSGVERDYGQAAYWYRKAAEQGNAAAQFELGALYDKGMGVSKNQSEAAKWFRKSAEAGIAPAQYNMGHMYATGEGVPQNWIFSHMWFTLAAVNGQPKARSMRELAAKNLTQAQVSISDRMVRERLANRRP